MFCAEDFHISWSACFGWVAQASGLSLRASRPQPQGDDEKFWFARPKKNKRCRTKFGGTPEFDGRDARATQHHASSSGLAAV
jgi:hypothetical protein